MEQGNPKLAIAILGSGKIGTDLLIKTTRSPWLQCVMFIGRDINSSGLAKARSLGVAISVRSIDALDQTGAPVDLVFDATSAEHHRQHAPRLAAAGIKAIDLTPAKVGQLCVPALNADVILQAANVNMVTCGGQASIPLIAFLARAIPGISRVAVHSLLAEDSVGPGTIANLPDYYRTTAAAIQFYTDIPAVEVDLTVEKSRWKPDMLTTIQLWCEDCEPEAMFCALADGLSAVMLYSPGYAIVGTPTYASGVVTIVVTVRGAGDWVPSHAGNLDIINCAAIAVAEKYARAVLSRRQRQYPPLMEPAAPVVIPNLKQA